MKHFIGVVLCTLSITAWSQEQLTGTVVDENNRPLSDASLFWENTTIGTTSDAKGFFEILAYENGVLVVSYVGYEALKLNNPSSNTLKEIILKPDSSLEEVLVTAKQRNSTRSLDGTANTITMNKGELLKAACCNVAEAFETNPAIDVNFADAITGTKQIKMLGLTSPYILIAEENIPSVRGASQAYGLSFTPGTWVESIQVTKGAGSVVNGYESISGQINTELIKPLDDIPLFVNFYGSTDARFEANVHLNRKVSKKWSSSLFLHSNMRQNKNDTNHDNFLDAPIGTQINVMNRWQYTDLENGIVSFLTLRYLKDNKQMGEVDFDKKTDKLKPTQWGSEINTEKVDLSAKTGYVFPDLPFQNIGLQISYNYHKQDSYFGLNPYHIQHNSLYTNLIFNSIISNTFHNFSTGASFTLDHYNEFVAFALDQQFDRSDNALGGFFEYSYNNTENLSFIAGLRLDYHNRMGVFMTPRFHLKYNPWSTGTFRLSGGRGKRLANIFAENQNFFASNKQFIIHNAQGEIYDLDPEIAWNYGVSFSQDFRLFNRQGSLTADFYRTDFINQIVVDIDQNAHQVNFYNLDGASFANSFQLDLNYNIAYNLNVRGAYKYYDIQTDYQNGRQERPLQSKHRLFANLEYETQTTEKGGLWKFDATYNWIGKQRLPSTQDYALENQLGTYATPFSTVNAQITKVFSDRFEIYVGVRI